MAVDPADYSLCAAAYRMDDADISGATYTDYSGHGNTGTAVNSPTPGQTGQIGQAVLFDKSSTEYIGCGNAAGVQIVGNITMAAWVNVTTAPSGEFAAHNYVIVKGVSDDTANIGYQLKLDYNVVQAGYFTTAGSATFGVQWVYSPVVIVAGVWYHVAATYDGTNWNIYWNGVLVASDNSGSHPQSVAGNLYIGGGTANTYGGLLDDVRLYSSALDATDIANLYAWRPSSFTWQFFGDNT